MPISKIVLDNQSKENVDLDGQYVRVPHGTTAQRPSNPAAGYMRFNTTLGTLEQWNTNTNNWAAIDSPPIISSLSYSGSNTATDPAGGEIITLTGSNFKDGFTIDIGGTAAASTTFVNTTTVRFTTPVKTAGDHDVTFTNSNGLAATLTNGISVNGLPAFTTAAGSLGTIESDVAMSTITIVAAEPDGGTLAYSITQNALPAGLSLGSANGQITGTPTSVSSTTTSNFTVTATDDEGQTNSRAFSLAVLRPVYVTQINQSLVFDGSASAVVGTTATASTTYTVSMWVKRSGRFDDYEYLWSNGNRGFGFWTGLTDSKFYYYNGSQLSASRMLRDVGTWMHVVFQNNAGTVTVWINGNQIYNASTGVALQTTTNATHIGRYYSSGNGGYYYDGYMADYHFIDGLAKSPTDFATEYNGVWTPIAYAGTYPGSSVRLEFADASDLGNDTSGNNNDYVLGGIQENHKKLDSPTINMCAFNSLAIRRDVATQPISYYDGNTRLSHPNASGNQTFGIGTHEVSSGKWYFEVWIKAASSNINIGIGTQGDINSSGQHYHGYRMTGAISAASGTNDGSGATYTTGDVIGCAFDLDAGTIKWYKNGTLQSTTTGIDSNDYIPFVKGTTSEEEVVNFGQDMTFAGYKTGGADASPSTGPGKFFYAPPTGHLALCSKNLSESPLNTAQGNQPEKNFACVQYNGTGSIQSITGVGFQPDFIWLKERGGSGTMSSHALFDTARGVTQRLSTNGSPPPEDLVRDEVTSFDSDGFTLGTSGVVNENGNKVAGWCFKAGGAPTATNSAGVGAVPTAGSVKIDGANKTDALAGTLAADKITANTKSGFSVVTYTGEGNGAKTIAHGLNSAPEMIWIKNRTDAENWCVYSSEIAATEHLRINATSTASSPVNQRWNSTRPTNTVFSIGASTTDNEVGSNGDEYVAYCWHSVPGFSKIGTYVGTGQSSNGPFVYCGFKPAFVIIKTLSSVNRWVMYDNRRSDGAGATNVQKNPILDGAELEAQAVGGEGSGANQTLDFYGNGFRLLRTGDVYNTSGHNYMFMAFAEDSYKYAEGR